MKKMIMTAVVAVVLTACGGGTGAKPDGIQADPAPSGPLLSAVSDEEFATMTMDEVNAIVINDKEFCLTMNKEESEEDETDQTPESLRLLDRLVEGTTGNINAVATTMRSLVDTKPEDQMGLAFVMLGQWPAMQKQCSGLGVTVAGLE